VMDELRAKGDPSNLEGQARFGIDVSKSLGISMSRLRPLAPAATVPFTGLAGGEVGVAPDGQAESGLLANGAPC